MKAIGLKRIESGKWESLRLSSHLSSECGSKSGKRHIYPLTPLHAPVFMTNQWSGSLSQNLR